MAIDFDSELFKSFNKAKQKDIIIEEFRRCQQSFEYYIKNYAFIKHPNVGIIQMDPFDFQLDTTIPISYVLLNRRTKKSRELLHSYKRKFDYEKWWNKIAEEQIELAKLVPPTFQHHYKTIVHSPSYNDRVDSIILKSRQTGLSTI